jgi:uncharacterized protein
MSAGGFESFSGRGPAFPLSLAGGGGVSESVGHARIQQALRMLLATQHGERVMRPDFGCNLRTLSFAPQTETTATLAGRLVVEGIERWEPRVELAHVRVEYPDAGLLLLHIAYVVRATREAGSMIYPFYLDRAEAASRP